MGSSRAAGVGVAVGRAAGAGRLDAPCSGAEVVPRGAGAVASTPASGDDGAGVERAAGVDAAPSATSAVAPMRTSDTPPSAAAATNRRSAGRASRR
jgi:hypothetical protein